jgi:hypothetical protein
MVFTITNLPYGKSTVYNIVTKNDKQFLNSKTHLWKVQCFSCVKGGVCLLQVMVIVFY